MNTKNGAMLQKITALAIGTSDIAKLNTPPWAAISTPMIAVSLTCPRESGAIAELPGLAL